MSQSKYISNAPLLDSFLKLDQKGSIIAEYVWIDSSNGTRSKCKTILPKEAAKIKKNIEERKAKEEQGTTETGPKKAKEAPKPVDGLSEWNFDGSSTGQADGKNSDVYLIPVATYPNPFLGGDNLLVMCETWHLDEETGSRYPNKYNHRHSADVLMSVHADKKYWFGLEQEYTMKDASNYPYGWPAGGFPAPQGPYYCGNGTGKVFGRDIADSHYKACLYAGIDISGTNAEVMPGQMEFQVGPSKGIELGDQLWIARFLLSRVAEKYGVIIDLHPKPIPGDWNGAGLHSNVSTEAMRNDGGYKDIEECMAKLEKRHQAHMEVYGEDNASRMTGQHETASFDKFSWGVADRGSSVRINRAVKDEGKGYFEDRRPASNADPYQVTGIIVETLEGSLEGIDILKEHQESKTQVNTMEIVQSKP